MRKSITGQRIAQLRKTRDLFQEDLAALTGISLQDIINYENGRREPNSAAIVVLEQYFGVSGAYLRGEDEGPDEETPAAGQPAGRFPQILKALRKERGLTQSQLAEALGLSNATITAYETGLRVPTLPSIATLEECFGITAAALMGLEPASPAAIHATAADKPLALTDTEARLLEDFRQLSAENQTTLLRLAAKFAAVDKAFTAWLDADEPC